MPSSPSDSPASSPAESSASTPPASMQGVRLPREARRRQLLDTARRIFSEHGFHRTTMDEIAEAAMVSKPVLYQHFKGKTELYEAVLDDGIELFERGLSAPLEEDLDNPSVTRATVEGLTRAIDEHPEVFRIIFESDVMSMPAVADRVAGLVERAGRRIADRIFAQAKLPRQDCLFVADLLMKLAISAAQTVAQTEQAERRAREQQLIYRLAWGGLNLVDEEEVWQQAGLG